MSHRTLIDKIALQLHTLVTNPHEYDTREMAELIVQTVIDHYIAHSGLNEDAKLNEKY